MFGLQFIAVNFLYLVFSLFMGNIIYIILAKKEKFTSIKRISIGIGTFLVVWMLPYYDLFIQKGIKTYYETFKMNNTIYAYPDKDENGKIESLGIGNVSSKPSDYISDQNRMIEHGIKWKKFVEKFVELNIYDIYERVVNNKGQIQYKKRETPLSKYIKLYLDKSPIYYEYIKDESEYHARYQVLGKRQNFYFFDEIVAEFWDTKKDILLAKSTGIGFNNGNDYNDKFRNKYLRFRGPSGIALTIQGVGNYREIYNELFFNSKSKNK